MEDYDALKFQFPSNGKARVNGDISLRHVSPATLFQFPSNGKARVNSESSIVGTKGVAYVSIPFKREGTGEPWGAGYFDLATEVIKFQFPSNGKARVNTGYEHI